MLSPSSGMTDAWANMQRSFSAYSTHSRHFPPLQYSAIAGRLSPNRHYVLSPAVTRVPMEYSPAQQCHEIAYQNYLDHNEFNVRYHANDQTTELVCNELTVQDVINRFYHQKRTLDVQSIVTRQNLIHQRGIAIQRHHELNEELLRQENLLRRLREEEFPIGPPEVTRRVLQSYRDTLAPLQQYYDDAIRTNFIELEVLRADEYFRYQRSERFNLEQERQVYVRIQEKVEETARLRRMWEDVQRTVNELCLARNYNAPQEDQLAYLGSLIPPDFQGCQIPLMQLHRLPYTAPVVTPPMQQSQEVDHEPSANTKFVFQPGENVEVMSGYVQERTPQINQNYLPIKRKRTREEEKSSTPRQKKVKRKHTQEKKYAKKSKRKDKSGRKNKESKESQNRNIPKTKGEKRKKVNSHADAGPWGRKHLMDVDGSNSNDNDERNNAEEKRCACEHCGSHYFQETNAYQMYRFMQRNTIVDEDDSKEDL